MSASEPPATPGWYPDPWGRAELRYHNGVAWTADVAVDGRRFVAPVPTGEPPRAVGGRTPDDTGPRNRVAVVALTLGILGVALAWMPLVFVVGVGLGVTAIVLGAIGLRRSRTSGIGRGFAITGVVTGVAALGVGVVGAWFTVATLRAVDRYDDPPAHTVEIDRCAGDGTFVTIEGRITNEGTRASAYSVRVEVGRGASGAALGRTLVDVDTLEPGETARFEVRRPLDEPDVRCSVVEVRGPLPFGIDPG